ILPGMKHLILMVSPSIIGIGQTIVRPARFGTVTKASSGTSIHSPPRRTRSWPSFDSQSGSAMVTPSVKEQHNPLPDASLSNQPFNSGWLGSWASAGTTKIAKNIPRSILGARFSSIIVPPSPDTIQAQAANKGKEEDTTHAILAVLSDQDSFSALAGIRRTFREKDARAGISQS